MPDLPVHADTLYRMITDQLGSVRALVRVSDGEIAQCIDYDAWGVITSDTGGMFQSLGHAGGLTDRSTALVRFGARDYDGSVGRWTVKDPIRFRGGDNLYAYVGLDPLNHYDQRGLTCDSNRDFHDWLTGRGKRNRYYPPGSTESREMSKSPGAASLRQQFIENGCDDLMDGECDTIEAYFKTIVNPTSTGFQVGGCDRAEVINNGNGTITIVMRNVAGTHSFFLHAVPDRKDAHGPMSNIHQVFKWTEPLPEECKECPEAKQRQ